MNFICSCYLGSSTQRRTRKPPPTTKSYACYVGKIKAAESVAHVLAGCFSLAQTKYLYRLNAALKILFFELLQKHGLREEVPPCFSLVMPKPAYQNTTSEAFWDIPIYADHNEVTANRIDARLVRHVRKEVCTIEMGCPWIESRAKKDEEKTLKYGSMMWELKQ